MSLSIKPGVKALGLRPELLLGMLVAEGVWAVHGRDLTVTSITDGKHSAGSHHYKGLAFDARSNDLSEPERKAILTTLKSRLGPEWDVVLEADHFHIEFDPKQ